jgi:hypothetical protein
MYVLNKWNHNVGTICTLAGIVEDEDDDDDDVEEDGWYCLNILASSF